MMRRCAVVSRYSAIKGIVCVMVVGLILLLSGCRTVRYYHQAIRGQTSVFFHREPISTVLADPAASVALKKQLRRVLDLREYGNSKLGLPVDDHYLTYVDLNRPHAVWNVHATPELSIEAKTWWYPLVGSQSYRGYFSETQAESYAAALRKKGYDVYVEGVDAYSTLGWFEDPVLSTFVDYPKTALAATLFHELAHQRLYLSGDTEFNEAFAVAVEREGVCRWLADRNRTGALEAYQAGLQRQDEFVNLILKTRERLERLYERDSWNARQRLKRKSQILSQLREDYRRLKQRWEGYSAYDWWFEQPLNNAQLNTIGTYYRLVPAFDRLIADAEGDLPRFYREVHRISRLGKTERHDYLDSLLRKRNSN